MESCVSIGWIDLASDVFGGYQMNGTEYIALENDLGNLVSQSRCELTRSILSI